MKRNSRLESCVLESEGDTEDDVDTDGTDTHTVRFHTFSCLHLLTYMPNELPWKYRFHYQVNFRRCLHPYDLLIKYRM